MKKDEWEQKVSESDKVWERIVNHAEKLACEAEDMFLHVDCPESGKPCNTSCICFRAAMVDKVRDSGAAKVWYPSCLRYSVSIDAKGYRHVMPASKLVTVKELENEQ